MLLRLFFNGINRFFQAPPSWSQWSRYGGCSVICGTGVQTRSRSCRTFSGNVGTGCPGSATQSQTCTGTQCCNWSQWASTGCNAPCGGIGTERRNRQCRNTQNGAFCNTCPGSGTDQRQCRGPTNCALWSNWNSWGRCSTTCGGGQRTRVRTCRDPTTGIRRNSCPGTGIQTLSCRTESCCQLTRWSAFGSCDAPCGRTGNQRRNRQCIGNNGQFCNTCVGLRTESRNCQGPPCCSWSQWGLYSACNAACEQSGTQLRSRSCRDSNGNPCGTCPGSGSETRPCIGGRCFRFADWTTWSTCSSACSQQRTRICQDGNNRRVNDRFCEDGPIGRSERNSCTGGSCLPAISQPWVSWGSWQPWALCTTTCGSGRRVRERICYYRGRANSPLPPDICRCVYTQGLGGRQEDNCPSQPPCKYFCAFYAL